MKTRKVVIAMAGISSFNIWICLAMLVYCLVIGLTLPTMLAVLAPVAGSIVLSWLFARSAKNHHKLDLSLSVVLSIAFIGGKKCVSFCTAPIHHIGAETVEVDLMHSKFLTQTLLVLLISFGVDNERTAVDQWAWIT